MTSDHLTILLTNNTLASRFGSELYVRDLALALKERGHRPIAFSMMLGEVAQEIRAAGIEVVSDLNDLPRVPDIIHGHHHLETMIALLHFPETPAISYCHGVIPWEEHPLRFPRILRYIAVDYACRDRFLDHAIPLDRLEVLLNFVDLERFKPRPPLPPRPRKALVFSNYVNQYNCLGIIQEAGRRSDLAIEVLGFGAGRGSDRPEEILPDYDLILAKGRAALEALAVGTAVITCDANGLGYMVTTSNLDDFRKLNFGIRTLKRPFQADTLIQEIKRYSADDAQEVSRRIRSEAGLDLVVERLLAIYHQVVAEHINRPTCHRADQKASSAYLGWLAPRIKGLGHVPELAVLKAQAWQDQTRRENTDLQLKLLEERLAHAVAQLEESKRSSADQLGSLEERLAYTLAQLGNLEERLAHTLVQLDGSERRLADHEGQIHALLNSRSWRITRPLRKIKTWLSLLPFWSIKKSGRK